MRKGKNVGLLFFMILAVGVLFIASGERLSAAPQGVFKQGIHFDISADWLDPATTAGVNLVVEAHEEFWRKVPHIKRMEFPMVKEPATRVAMLRRGELDSATLLQGVFYEDVKKDPKLTLYSPLSPTKWLVYFASQWDPKSPWSDARVRKAASLAIDRQTIADIHMPGCEGTSSIGLAGDSWAIQFPVDPYDPQKAKKLLAEAGYPNGFHGGTFYPYEGGYWPYGEQVATYWKAIGISMGIRLLDRPAFRGNREGGKMKGATFIDSSSAPTIGGRLAFLFGPRSYGNYPDIQSLWTQYNKEVDLKSRKELIGQIQKLIYVRTMFIPITSTNSPAGFGARIKGNPYRIQPHLWFMVPFEDAELK